MKKAVISKLLPIIILIISVVIISVTYRYIFGLHIRHYNQYIIPCQGQRIAYTNYSIPLTFFVLDEVDLSELASNDNIMMINLKSDDGLTVQASNWEIKDGAGFYSGTEFFAKRLKVFATFTMSMNINVLEIVYVDKTELFDIGDLYIKLIITNNNIADTQIFSSFLDLSTQNSSMDQNSDFFSSTMTLFSMQANSFSEMGYRVQNIDLGINGLYINPSSLRMVGPSMNYGNAFTQDSENAEYLTVMNVDVIPNIQVDINVAGTEVGYIYTIFGLLKTENYNMQPIATYYCPVFICLDIESNETYEYGDPNNVFIDTPYFINDNYVRDLIEDYGI